MPTDAASDSVAGHGEMLDGEGKQPTSPELRLLATIGKLARRLETGYEQWSDRISLSPQLAEVLYVLHRQGSPHTLRMSDLANGLALSAQATTYRVDRLVDLGFVIRKFDVHDRRVLLVTATEKGLAEGSRVSLAKAAYAERMFGRMDRQLVANLTEALMDLMPGDHSVEF